VLILECDVLRSLCLCGVGGLVFSGIWVVQGVSLWGVVWVIHEGNSDCGVCVCMCFYYTAFSSAARAVPYLLQGFLVYLGVT